MIDWNLELNNTIAKKEQAIADDKAKKLKEQQEKEQARLDYIEYCKVFDKVIQEEIAGVREILDRYKIPNNFTYKITITSGNIRFDLDATSEKWKGCGTWQDLGVATREGTDLAEYTRQRLSFIVMYLILECSF